MMDNQLIYVIRASCGAHKIGKADDATSRIRSIRCAIPDGVLDVRYVAKINDDPDQDRTWSTRIERALHRRYKACRIRPDGEWFRLSESDVREIASFVDGYKCAWEDATRPSPMHTYVAMIPSDDGTSYKCGRKPRPWYWHARDAWYAVFDGKRYRLATGRGNFMKAATKLAEIYPHYKPPIETGEVLTLSAN